MVRALDDKIKEIVKILIYEIGLRYLRGFEPQNGTLENLGNQISALDVSQRKELSDLLCGREYKKNMLELIKEYVCNGNSKACRKYLKEAPKIYNAILRYLTKILLEYSSLQPSTIQVHMEFPQRRTTQQTIIDRWDALEGMLPNDLKIYLSDILEYYEDDISNILSDDDNKKLLENIIRLGYLDIKKVRPR